MTGLALKLFTPGSYMPFPIFKTIQATWSFSLSASSYAFTDNSTTYTLITGSGNGTGEFVASPFRTFRHNRRPNYLDYAYPNAYQDIQNGKFQIVKEVTGVGGGGFGTNEQHNTKYFHLVMPFVKDCGSYQMSVRTAVNYYDPNQQNTVTEEELEAVNCQMAIQLAIGPTITRVESFCIQNQSEFGTPGEYPYAPNSGQFWRYPFTDFAEYIENGHFSAERPEYLWPEWTFPTANLFAAQSKTISYAAQNIFWGENMPNQSGLYTQSMTFTGIPWEWPYT